MEMLLKYIFFLIIISCTNAEPLLRSLYGKQIQATACSVSGAHCEGVVLLADWVAVLDSCIRAQNTEDIYVRKGIVNCTQAWDPRNGCEAQYTRFHQCRNFFTSAMGSDRSLDRWMESILYPLSTKQTYTDHTESYHQIEYHMYASPIKMFLATVVLPLVSFILLFLFIVFCTGTSDDTRRISYKTLSNEGFKACVV